MGDVDAVARLRWRYPRKRIGQGVLDGFVWAVGLYTAALLRLDLDVGRVHTGDLAKLLPVVFVAQYLAGAGVGPSRAASRNATRTCRGTRTSRRQ